MIHTMKYSRKAKLGIVIGMGLIVFTVSLLSLPFSDSQNVVQKATQTSIEKVESSEAKMLDVIAQERAELEWKIGGKLQP
jgi:hypothetical protein